MRRVVLSAALLCACHAADPPQDATATPPLAPAPATAPVTSSAPVGQASGADATPGPASATSDADGPACDEPPIYRVAELRDGLPGASETCRSQLASLRGLTVHGRCETDADCSIIAVAGGCMGVGMSRKSHKKPEPLERACLPDAACWDSDFTDHHISCQAGCCSIYET